MTSEQRDQLHKYMAKRARTGFPVRGYGWMDWYSQFKNRDGQIEIIGQTRNVKDLLMSSELNRVLRDVYAPLNEIDIDLIMAYVPARWPA